jgi:hypothetical protein
MLDAMLMERHSMALMLLGASTGFRFSGSMGTDRT